jgi:uncharacterized DUF497 family protein
MTALDNRQDYGEERRTGLGLIDNRTVALVFTQPAANRIRVISLRKASRSERLLFEKEVGSKLWNIEPN